MISLDIHVEILTPYARVSNPVNLWRSDKEIKMSISSSSTLGLFHCVDCLNCCQMSTYGTISLPIHPGLVDHMSIFSDKGERLLHTLSMLKSPL